MNHSLVLAHNLTETVPLRAASALPPAAFERIRRTVMLRHCKWDSQVGDVTTLAPFPLVLREREWNALATSAEQLAAEITELERVLLRSPELLAELNVPRAVRAVVDSAPAPAPARVMRFDFHLTTEGWLISEVNSDVPGGYAEASSFTALIAESYPELRMCGDPAPAWADALASISGGAPLALLSATGYMEDQQILAFLSSLLRERGCDSYLCAPAQLEWRDGSAELHTNYYSGRLGAIVRFYQGEWLAKLPTREGWQHLFADARTPVANPGLALISESKRLPLIFRKVPVDTRACRQFFPETYDPRDFDWTRDDRWLLKSAFCNTGDTVAIREFLPLKKWNDVVRDVHRNPGEWLVQRRFETRAVPSPLGPVFPCIGVYTVNGRAAGAYGRISYGPIIDFTAIDIAVLFEAEDRAP